MVAIRLIMWSVTAIIACAFYYSCTSKPEERFPDDEVMHFPTSMTLHNSFLAISSSSADGKYHAGRLMVIDTSIVKEIIESKGSLEPISLKKIVRTNFMIPEESGEIYFSSDFLITAGRKNSEMVAVSVKDDLPQCNKPRSLLKDCKNAQSITLPNYDPHALVNVVNNSLEEQILGSYLSSDRIDMIKIEKGNNAISITKSLHANQFLKPKLKANALKNQRIITRKMQLVKASDEKIYFLFEQHSQRTQAPTKPRGTFLVAIKTSELIASSAPEQVEIWNLNELASIAGAQDFFVDEAKREAYVLARVPEAIYKLNLANASIMDVGSVCTGATSMALDPDEDRIVIPCVLDNRLIALSMKDLTIKGTSKVLGRGPSSVVIDKTTGYIFSTISGDGIVAIVDDKLNYIGRIFEKAPSNRVGS